MLTGPYASYKESGGPWLSAIPEHWEQRALATVSTVRNDRGHPDLPLLSVFLDRGVIRYEEGGGQVHAPSLDLSNYQVVEPGDFVLNNQQAWRGSVGTSRHRGIISPAYIVLKLSSRINSGFATHLVRSPVMVDQFVIASKGVGDIQRQIFWPFLRQAQVPIPPADEQVAIVQYLDYMDRRVRRYIRAKQKLIRLLEEQAHEVINAALTRGLDSTVPLKLSGIDGLESIPHNWDVVPLKRRIGFQEGPGIMAADFRSEGTPLLRISCLDGDEVSLSGCNFLDPLQVEKRWSHFAVSSGDYLLSASGSLGGMSRVTYTVAGAIPYTGIIRFWALDPRTVDMEFVRYFIVSDLFQQQIRFMKTGVGIEHFGPSHLNRMWLILPPLSEQRALVTHLAVSLSTVEQHIALTKRQIGLLQEYRTRLIADVVTGKLDVREVAASLPDENSQEDALLDELELFAEDGLEEDESGLDASLEEVEA